MNHEEEQQQELEAIGYIYQENELLIFENGKSLEISIQLDDPELENIEQQSGEDESDEESESGDDAGKLLFKVRIDLPAEYPEVEPILAITSKYLLKKEITDLQEAASAQCKDSLGDAMIYTVVSFLKEQAEETIKQRIARIADEVQQEKDRQEQEEAKRYQGTRVTPESFLAWRQGFVKEAKVALKSGKPLIKAFEAALAVEKLIQTSSKPTGRQLFESGDMVKSDEQFGGEGADVEVDTALIHGLKNMDLEEEEENLVLSNLTED